MYKCLYLFQFTILQNCLSALHAVICKIIGNFPENVYLNEQGLIGNKRINEYDAYYTSIT